MKTPMQEHLEWLKNEHKKYTDQARKESSMQILGYAFKINDCIKHAESMLEKEKEAMCEFAWEYAEPFNDWSVVKEHFDAFFKTEEI